VGEGWMLSALDESFLTNQIGKPSTVEIPPEKAFGTRDPEKVRMISRRWLSSRGITPQIGMQLEYDGRPAVVRTIGAGRVQLDFNPPLAGKTLVYEVTVQDKLGTIKEKINALVHRRLPFLKDKTDIKTRKSVVTIPIPAEAFYVEGLQIAKRGIALDIQKFFPQMTTVRFIEEHTTQNQTPDDNTS
jgi:peptidylprolyl isomerase